jgi:hypothetical protein
MALPLLTKHLVETKLNAYGERKIPPHARDQVRLGFVIEGNKVTLNEERVPFREPGTWIAIPIAQLRFEPDTALWSLYASKLKQGKGWLPYPVKPNKDIDKLIEALDTDKSGIFWG